MNDPGRKLTNGRHWRGWTIGLIGSWYAGAVPKPLAPGMGDGPGDGGGHAKMSLR